MLRNSDIRSVSKQEEIKNLKECTLYTVDVSPVDANGHSIRPSEQFGSVHSTLCPGNDDDQESNSFWFGEENSSDKDDQQGNAVYVSLVRYFVLACL